MRAKYPSYAELLETFELRAGFRLWRKEYVDERGRKRGGSFVNNVANCRDGYCKVGFKGRMIKYHAAVLILYEKKDAPSGCVVNHKDNDKLNNHPKNLEWVSQRENVQKKRIHNEGQGFPGVSWFKRDGKWEARIQVDGKNIRLGFFDTELDAFDSYIRENEERGFPVGHLLGLRAKHIERVQVAEKRT